MEIEKCIGSVVEQFQKNPKDLNKNMEIYLKYSNRKIPISRWNYTFYIANFLNNIDKTMEITYYLAGQPQLCTGKVQFFINQKQTEYGIERTGYILTPENLFHVMERDGQINQSYVRFLNTFYKRIQSNKICSINIILSKLKGYQKEEKHMRSSIIKSHSTMLFVENKTDRINMYFYDPHGSSFDNNKYEKEAFLFQTRLAEELRKLSKKPVNFILEHNFSCPRGIQAIIPESSLGRRGYCVIYSYFWLYIILHCFNRIPNVDLETLIFNVETQVLKAKNIDKIIYNFAENIVNTSLTEMPDREVIFKNLNDYILKMALTDYPDLMTSVETLENRKIITEGQTSSSRKKDYSECQKNEDCLSHCCSKTSKKCREVDYTVQLDKQDCMEDIDDYIEEPTQRFINTTLRDEILQLKNDLQILYSQYPNATEEKKREILQLLDNIQAKFKSMLKMLILEGQEEFVEKLKYNIKEYVKNLEKVYILNTHK